MCYFKCNTWVTSECNARGLPQVQHARLLEVQRASPSLTQRCVLRGRGREQRACIAHAHARVLRVFLLTGRLDSPQKLDLNLDRSQRLELNLD